MRMEYSSLVCEQCEFLDKIGDDLDIQHISRSQEHYLELTHVSDMAGRFWKSKGTNITLDWLIY